MELGMSHSSLQEVDWSGQARTDMGAAGPLLPDRLRVRGRQGRGQCGEEGRRFLDFFIFFFLSECNMTRNQVPVHGAAVGPTPEISGRIVESRRLRAASL